MTKYVIEGGKVVRKGKFCPRCGMGVFLADHPDRLHCGRCGYTEFKPGVPRLKHKPSPKPVSAPKKEAPKLAAEPSAAPAVAGKGAALGKGAAPAKGGAAPAKGALAPAKGLAPAKAEPKKEEVSKGKKK